MTSTPAVLERISTRLPSEIGSDWLVPVAITFCKSSIVRPGSSGYWTATKYWLPDWTSIVSPGRRASPSPGPCR